MKLHTNLLFILFLIAAQTGLQAASSAATTTSSSSSSSSAASNLDNKHSSAAAAAKTKTDINNRASKSKKISRALADAINARQSDETDRAALNNAKVLSIKEYQTLHADSDDERDLNNQSSSSSTTASNGAITSSALSSSSSSAMPTDVRSQFSAKNKADIKQSVSSALVPMPNQAKRAGMRSLPSLRELITTKLLENEISQCVYTDFIDSKRLLRQALKTIKSLDLLEQVCLRPVPGLLRSHFNFLHHIFPYIGSNTHNHTTLYLRSNGVMAQEGNRLVTGSGDGTAEIRELRDGYWQLAHTILHEDNIRAVALEGNCVVTGSDDGTAQIHERVNGRWQLVHTIQHKSYVAAVALKGNRVVTGSYDGTAQVHERVNGRWQLVHTIQHKAGAAEALAEKVFAMLEENRVIHNKYEVWAVALEGDRVVTGSLDGTAQIHELRNGSWQLVHTIQHKNRIDAVALEGNCVVTGSLDRTAQIHERVNGHWQLVHTIQHKGLVHIVALKGNRVVTGSLDRTAQIHERVNGRWQLEHTIQHKGRIDAVALKGNRVVTGSYDGTVQIHEWVDGCWQLVQTIQFESSVKAVALEDSQVAIAYNNPVMACSNIVFYNFLSPATDINYTKGKTYEQYDLIDSIVQLRDVKRRGVLVLTPEQETIFKMLPAHTKQRLIKKYAITCERRKKEIEKERREQQERDAILDSALHEYDRAFEVGGSDFNRDERVRQQALDEIVAGAVSAVSGYGMVGSTPPLSRSSSSSAASN